MPSTPEPPAKSPNVAAILTWLVPGAGHAYLGHAGVAVAAFVIVEGLYALGLLAAGGILRGAMTFEYLEPELRGPFAVALAPEVGNLGGLIWQMRTSGFGPEPYVPRPWPPLLPLGSMLCALSGIANACLMAHANLAARRAARATQASAESRRRPSPALLAWMAWLVPGLGHWLQGRRRRAVIVAAVLVGMFALGTLLAEGTNLSRERHFYYWGGQVLLGLPAIAAELASGHPAVSHAIPRDVEGLLFACLAGLLNVLAILDVYAWGEADALGRDPRAPRGHRAEKRRP